MKKVIFALNILEDDGKLVKVGKFDLKAVKDSKFLLALAREING